MKGIRVKLAVILSLAGDGYLAYDTASDRLHHLNPAASLVIELCDGTRDRETIRQLLLPVVNEHGWPACGAWLDTAMTEGLLETVSENTNEAAQLSAEDLATLARDLRRDDRVLPAFVCQQRATELAPNDAGMWFRLAELAHIVGRRDVARAAYERYFEKHPEDAEIEHLLIALRDNAPPTRAPDRYIEQLYERFASFYEENMCGSLHYQGPALLHDAMLRVLGERRDLNVLDLGCGTGLVGETLRPLAHRLTGVDLSASMIERARERQVYDVLRVMEMTAFLEAGDGSPFDVIASCEALIYFGDLRQVIVPAARLLSPHGLVAFTVERGDVYPFQLTDSGRYAHHRDHLSEVASAAGLSVAYVGEEVLRYEYGEEAWGLLAVLS